VRDALGLLRDSLRPAFPDELCDEAVDKLGRQIGYGAMMASASRMWRLYLKEKGIAGGEFTVGHCHSTVKSAVEAFDELLEGRTR